MNRFLRISISRCDATLDGIAGLARGSSLDNNPDKGFEIESVTRKMLVLTWAEKIVVERTIDSGVFSGTSFKEVRIVTFGFIINSKADTAIVLDPPLGKERLHKVLRLLFPTGNFRFHELSIRETLEDLSARGIARITAIETLPVSLESKVVMSLKVAGDGDLLGYINENHPTRTGDYRAASMVIFTPEGRTIDLSLVRTGLIRTSRNLNAEEVERIIALLKFR